MFFDNTFVFGMYLFFFDYNVLCNYKNLKEAKRKEQKIISSTLFITFSLYSITEPIYKNCSINIQSLSYYLYLFYFAILFIHFLFPNIFFSKHVFLNFLKKFHTNV